MTKLLILLILSCSTLAQITKEKSSYLVEVLDVGPRWTQSIDRSLREHIISSPVMKLVKAELRQYITKKHPLTTKQVLIKEKLLTSLSVEELNKVIAIFELPVMKKLNKELQTVDQDFSMKIKESLAKKDFELLKIKDMAQRKVEKLRNKK